jgi:uncharacterized membrane protein YoaK (UPF0700 family)
LTGIALPSVSPHQRGIALILLAFTAGTMDTIAFLTLGEVFTSAMSGNTVLFGLALGQGHLAAASRALTAFAGYVCGVIVTSAMLRPPERGIRRALGLELLFVGAFTAWWTIRGGGTRDPTDPYGLIVLSAIAMGLQGGIGRAIRVPGIPTIVITSTLTAIVGGITERVLAQEKPLTSAVRQQIGAYTAYFVSAIVSGIAVWSGLLAAVPFIALAAVFAAWLGVQRGSLRLEPD